MLPESLCVDCSDFNFGIWLSVTHFAFAVFFGSVGKYSDLFAFAVFDNFTGNFCALNNWGAYNHTIFFANSDNVEFNVCICFQIELFNLNYIAYGYAILFAAGFDNCVHNHIPLSV